MPHAFGREKAAFPSLRRDYLWISVEGVGAHAGIRSAVYGLYRGGHAFLAYGAREHIYDILSGVTQACPLSGWFCAAFDPCLRWLTKVLALRRGLAEGSPVLARTMWARCCASKARHLAHAALVYRSARSGVGGGVALKSALWCRWRADGLSPRVRSSMPSRRLCRNGLL